MNSPNSAINVVANNPVTPLLLNVNDFNSEPLNTIDIKSMNTPPLPSPPQPPPTTTPITAVTFNSQLDTHNHNLLKLNECKNESLDVLINNPYIPVYKHNYVGTFKATCVNVPKQQKPSSMTLEECNKIDNEIAIGNVTLDSEIADEEDDKELSIIKEDISEIEIIEISDDEDEVEEQFEYTDDDLDEALLAEQDIVKPEAGNVEEDQESDDPITPVNTPKHIESSFDISEGHYMPMTPKKAILTSSASETSILAMDILNSIRNGSTDMIEENPYIEMSSGILNGSEKQSSTYEFVMVSNKKEHNEPLYMELSQSTTKDAAKNKIVNDGKGTIKKGTLKRHSDKGTSRKPKRHDLPDILKQSSNYLKSDDSSDADDEDGSKDLNSGGVTMKSRSRFSLSDTFRPASYYLGASTSSSIHKNLPLAECIDSSDSEIVSPPPIPTSPPPTEELFSSENFNTIKRNVLSNEISHQRTMSASSNPLSEATMAKILDSTRNSRLSLPDQLYKQHAASNDPNIYLNLPQFEQMKNIKMFSTASNCSINTDDGSNTSSDFDLYNKIKLQSPSISADSLNQSQLSLSETSPRPPRPRPLSDDSLFKFEEESNANDKLDHYLSKLETSDLYLYGNNSKEQTNWMTESLKNMPIEVTATEANGSDNIGQHYENVNLMEEATKNKSANSLNLMYYDSLEDVSAKTAQETSLQPLKEKNLSLHDANYESEDLKHKNYQIDVNSIDLDQQSSCTVFDLTQPSHSRQNSNLSDSAPYYYSDLSSASAAAAQIANHKLNNQRELNTKKNPNYISHIHNLINNANKQQLTSILSTAAEKDQSIDSRNIYESGSGRLNKYVNKEEPTTSFANTIYYHEKNTNAENSANLSTSIDNLLYTATGNNENIDGTTDCDQLWEEDAIWRESLRRVSQRHARSLDDLDRIESISQSATKAARISDADRQWGIVKNAGVPSSTSSTEERQKQSRTKITRDVTYVNDEQFQRTLTKKKKNLNPLASAGKMDENDVYVQLACGETAIVPPVSDVYEILREELPPQNLVYSSSFVDRENIRQWDLMSSGLVKSSSNKVLKGSTSSMIIGQHKSLEGNGSTGDNDQDARSKTLGKPMNYR